MSDQTNSSVADEMPSVLTNLAQIADLLPVTGKTKPKIDAIYDNLCSTLVRDFSTMIAVGFATRPDGVEQLIEVTGLAKGPNNEFVSRVEKGCKFLSYKPEVQKALPEALELFKQIIAEVTILHRPQNLH